MGEGRVGAKPVAMALISDKMRDRSRDLRRNQTDVEQNMEGVFDTIAPELGPHSERSSSGHL